ncbi:MAG: hypothetical protein ACEQR8_11015 [Cypionkella sp.]
MVNQNFPDPGQAGALPPEWRIALAYTLPAQRPALAALVQLDTRLGEAVARAREPLLGQVRLAWWRERLSDPVGPRTRGEPLLERVQAHWGSRAATLVPLVDGWEERLGEPPLELAPIAGFADGRGRALAAFAELAGAGAKGNAAFAAGKRWALAELAARTARPGERAAAAELARALALPGRLPRALRGIAVIDGLAARALRTGQPLLAGRGAPLAALRLGMLGR